MELPRTERMLALLKENPDGLGIDELRVLLKVRKNNDVSNTIQLLKKRCKIKSTNGKLKLISVNKGTHYNLFEKELYEKIIATLKKHPDGITTRELASKCDIEPKKASNKIIYLKSKGYKINSSYGNYFYQGEDISDKPKESIAPQINSRQPTVERLIPKELQNTFLSLSDSDKADCIDMLRKSIYYRKSAVALLESNAIALNYAATIERGRDA